MGKYNKITPEHIAEGYRQIELYGSAKKYAREQGLSPYYFVNKLGTYSVRDSYLANPNTPLSACGGLSGEARL